MCATILTIFMYYKFHSEHHYIYFNVVKFTEKYSDCHYLKLVSIVADIFTANFYSVLLQCICLLPQLQNKKWFILLSLPSLHRRRLGIFLFKIQTIISQLTLLCTQDILPGGISSNSLRSNRDQNSLLIASLAIEIV